MKDNFSFIDEILEDFPSWCYCKSKECSSYQNFSEAKQSLIKNFEKLVLEVIGEDNGCGFCDDVRQAEQRKALESMLSKSIQEQEGSHE